MSRPMPWQPMRPPEKHVSQDQMWETLAKHCPVPEKPKPLPLKPLEWDRPVRTGDRSGYMASLCGRYTVSKDAVADGTVYTAWKRVTVKGQAPVNLGCSVKRSEAERMCNEDSWQMRTADAR